MNRTAGLPVFAAFLGICAVGLAAAALSSSLPVAPYELPEASGGSGLSPIGLILYLINLILTFLFGPGSGPLGGGEIALGRLIVLAVEFFYQWLPVFLTLSVLSIALAAALSYTDRRPLSLMLFSAEQETTGKSSTAMHTPTQSTSELSNEVYRAWFTLVQSLSIDRVESKTPTECAAVAVDRGFDREAVETLHSEFERVRYGGQSLTDNRKQRVRHALARLNLDSEDEATAEEVLE